MIRENRPLIVFGKHQFEAEEEDEVNFQTGDPILVLEKDEEFNDGWWKGCTVKGEIGIFPANYITTENIFNINLQGLFDEKMYSQSRYYVSNIIDDENGLSPFGTFNSLSNNNSEDGINSRSLKSAESTNSSSGLYENHPSSPNDSVSSMHALSSPRMSTSLPNNIRMMGGDLERIPVDSSKPRNNVMSNPLYSHSQPSLQHPQSQSQQQQQNHFSQSQQSQSSELKVNTPQVRRPQDWDVEEVCHWLSTVNCESIIPAIKENEVTGNKLLGLNLSKLREYGLNSLSERIELLHEILSLREEYSESNRNIFNSMHTSNASSYTSDYESFSGSQTKFHKPSSNFSLSEYYDKSENENENEESNPIRTKSLSSNENNRFNSNQDNKYHYHHEFQNQNQNQNQNSQNYKKPVIPAISNNYGGMVGIPSVMSHTNSNDNGNGTGSGNRNRSLSLQNESHHNSLMKNGNDHLSRSYSISTSDRFTDKSNVDFQNAERKGWLFVRFDDEMNWKKRWVVLIENRLFILQSPDNNNNSNNNNNMNNNMNSFNNNNNNNNSMNMNMNNNMNSFNNNNNDNSMNMNMNNNMNSFNNNNNNNNSMNMNMNMNMNSFNNNMMAPKILSILELDLTYKVLPDNDSNNPKEHNFLLQDPRLGNIHLAADNQLSVVTWINVLVRACTNTKRKPLPLIPLKNNGRQVRDALLSSTQAVSTLTYDSDKVGSNYSNIFEESSVEFNNVLDSKSKNSNINTSINGIVPPNIESDYAGSFSKLNDDSSISEHTQMLKGRTATSVSNTFPINPISPISPTQTAAAAANGWYRTTAKSATDYSNYRNLQNVSQETRLKLQKTAKKLAEPVVVTPILNPKKTMSFNPNKLDPEDDFTLNNDQASVMSFLNNNEFNSSIKNGNLNMNSGGNNNNDRHTSIASGYSNYGYSSHNNNNNLQVSAIEMMERRGIGSFITNNQNKVSKRTKLHNFIFK